VSIVLKSWSLNLLEPSGPVQACNGIAFYLILKAFLGLKNNILDIYKNSISAEREATSIWWVGGGIDPRLFAPFLTKLIS
jgi:hypothetical protein